jgi:hypothetical protein
MLNPLSNTIPPSNLSGTAQIIADQVQAKSIANLICFVGKVDLLLPDALIKRLLEHCCVVENWRCVMEENFELSLIEEKENIS